MRFDCDVATDNLIDGRLVSLRCDFSNEKFKTFKLKTFNNINFSLFSTYHITIKNF